MNWWDGHIAVEILVEKLPQRAQLGIEAFCNLIGALLFGVIAYQAVLYALDMKKSGEVSLTLADLIKSLQRTLDA